MTTETKTEPKVDFSKVESLRRHMLITASQMAELFRVSRMTYYSWVRGKTVPRGVHRKTVRTVLKKLLDIMVTYNWPPPEVIASESKDRFARLQALLARQDA